MERQSNNKKVMVVGRNRLPSNNSSTLTSGGTRGTSTPTGNISKNRSCNFSPITNPDTIKPNTVEKTEPKLLKTLGPTFSHNHPEKKTSCSKTRTADEQASLLYMAYQQQHFLNEALQDLQRKVDQGCQKQLEDLWNLVKLKEKEVKSIEDRTKLVNNHQKISHLISQLEPEVKDAIDIASCITLINQELAQTLDSKRHLISMEDMNSIEKDEMKKITNILNDGAKLCEKINPQAFEDATSTSTIILRLNETTEAMTRVMSECQQVSTTTVARLGQEILLIDITDETKTDFKGISDIVI